MKAGAAALLAVVLAACAHAPRPADPVDRAAAWLHGRFDNAGQAARDRAVPAMRVRWTPLWRDRTDGRWFLVEQALAATPDRPYRRRVHRLRDDGEGGVLSEVFLLPAGDGPQPAASLAPDALVARPGCTVHLRPAGAVFRGGTRGRDCPSRFRGAAFTTAEVVLDAAGFASWERGFTADGGHAWGSPTGPYVFRRSRQNPSSDGSKR